MDENLMIWWARQRGWGYNAKVDVFLEYGRFIHAYRPIPREQVEKDFTYFMGKQKDAFRRLFQ